MRSSADPRAATSWRILRWVVGLQFVAAGCFSALQWQATVDFNALLVGPTLAPSATLAQVLLALLGGVSWVGHVRPRWGAIALLIFLVPATMRHVVAAQAVADLAATVGPGTAQEALAALARRGQLAAVAKNVALIGLAVFVAVRGSLGEAPEIPAPSIHS